MSIEAKLTGTLINAKTATFNDEDTGRPITYGKVQLLITDRSGDFKELKNIKVKSENFSALADLQSSKGKTVTVDLEASEYQGKTTWYLADPNRKAA